MTPLFFTSRDLSYQHPPNCEKKKRVYERFSFYLTLVPGISTTTIAVLLHTTTYTNIVVQLYGGAVVELAVGSLDILHLFSVVALCDRIKAPLASCLS